LDVMNGCRQLSVSILPFIVVLSLLLSPCPAREPKMDPATKKVRVLYIGDIGWETWGDIAQDPFLSVQPVTATIGHFPKRLIQRSMRMYIPRTYDSYVEKIDICILSDTDHTLFTPAQEMMFKKGVVEAGQGLIMAGGFEAFGGAGWGTSWEGSAVIDALPVDVLSGQSYSLNPFYARPTKEAEKHPFVTSLPWDTMPPFGGMNVVIPKEWSIVLLEARGTGISLSQHKPVLVYGEVGRGASLAHAPDWNPGWGDAVMRDWEYYPDYLINMVYLVAGIPIPQDVQLVHLVRQELSSYWSQRSVTMSMLEFAEKFGANVVKLEERLAQINGEKAEADELYLHQDYEGVLSKMAKIRQELMDINSKAVKLKDQALFWVYVIEWFAVTATMMIAGLVLWTLMIRRRIYKEVKVTRFNL